MDKKGKHHRIRIWKNKYPKPSSEPSTSHSSLPVPAARGSFDPMSPNTAGTSQVTDHLVSVGNTSGHNKQPVTPETGAATNTLTAAASGADHNYPGVSRTDAWLGRATLFLKITKEVADATGILAPLKAACGATITLLEAVQAVKSNRDAWTELISSLKRHQEVLLVNLDRNNIGDMAVGDDHPLKAAIKDYQAILIELLAHIFREAGVTEADIEDANISFKRLATRIGTTDSETGAITEFRDRLREANGAIMLSVQVYIAKWVSDMKENELLKELRIAGLEHGSRVAACMGNTRQGFLKAIENWSMDMEAPNILWIEGHPGVGKSAIATSLVNQLRASSRLGSYFFFQRQKASEMTANALWRTVAYDLAQTYPTVRSRLVEKLEAKEMDLVTTSTDDLFRNLVYDPLIASNGIPVDKSPVIIIDALDECGGVVGQRSEHRKRLMPTLRKWSELPKNFKLVITSRAEGDVKRLFSGIMHKPLAIPVGQPMDDASSNDIRTFLESEFRRIQEGDEMLSSDWPGSQTIQELSVKAGGLFIWAKTVVGFIEEATPKRRLRDVLGGKGIGGVGTLDGAEVGNMGHLYSQVIGALFPQQTRDNLNEFRSIVGTVIIANTPLTTLSLAHILSIDEEMVVHICRGLQAVMEYTGPLRFKHQSFVDFLLDPVGCPPDFHVDFERANAELTVRCLITMTTKLEFNICKLESSCLSNAEVKDLDVRVRQRISGALQYSCTNWHNHLCSDWDPACVDIVTPLDEFLMGKRLLYWMEVLSVMGKAPTGISALRQVKACTSKIGKKHRDVVEDALRFILAFVTPISTSAPHVYMSTLPFTPRTSTLWKNVGRLFPNALNVCKGRPESWPAPPITWLGHTGAINGIAYSPDGQNVVSGSDDKTVRIWDAQTGAAVGQPLQGHTSGVQSVAYSPDGRNIVSGSSDKTVRIWDAQTGAAVGQPLQGHTSGVQSVAYSPDGRNIVSGSDDKTVRIWDAQTGAAVGQPLEGHTYSVQSIAYSPDGRNIVSGSWDKTVRIWDAQTGAAVGQPLQGHTSGVQSVAYSPDGRNIVSGSDENTVRIWDAQTGAAVGQPLQGHTYWVNSVAYSPDGRNIVSGSWDKTVRIWDAQTGAAVGQPLQGHTSGVQSVAYSPDGRNIVSGSDDNTVRIWDAQTGAAVGQPLQGHTYWVNSVAYSPDGRNIVSGSYDNTVRIWDAQTGAAVGQPLQGHTYWVNSVAYSPDGRNIVSGSNDETVRIWDAQTRAAVGQPLEGHTHWVSSVAYSPDGRNIVSGSDDNTVRIWDAQTGAAVGQPLEGHTYSVQSIAYSPDGRNIVSGSWDKTVRIWDAQTGAAVGQPLQGHTSGVQSVAYSPDGRNIVSGSNDETVRIWDAQTGAAVGQPLQGHTSGVQSVAYSPDGRNIVSGSSDKTVRIWDAQTGAAVGQPMEGHTQPISSVAYSPDGRNIVSGSSDETVRIWDAQAGAAVGQPLEGHTHWVSSVAYSPDGRNIVSGSDDNTVRIWDAQTGAAVGQPLEGHTNWVSSVAYSPDGRNIVPGSDDETVRIWDAQTGAAVGQPMEGHTQPISSVAYSPDGRNIVSGSWDKTVRIWDAQTGAAVGQPMEGHTQPISSVAYSPDGRNIVSGSDDKTVRIWDAQAGAAVGQPLEGHTRVIDSIAYSPDGRNVVSGSEDNTIRAWDAHSRIMEDDAVSHSSHPPNDPYLPLTTFSGRLIPMSRLGLDGWVRGAEGLLFWIPEDSRHGLTCPAIVTVPNMGRQRCVRIDFSQFQYGASWTNIRG